MARKYTCQVGDGKPEVIDLEDFIQTNTDPDVEPLSAEEVIKLRTLRVGRRVVLGGGAGETFIVRRVK